MLIIDKMVLVPELIPAKAFWVNLRSELSRSKWNEISKYVISDNDNTCCKCGKQSYEAGVMHCHESWLFTTNNTMQRLIGLVCVCSDCHNVIHWGSSQFRKLDMNKLMKHATKVNNCTERQFTSVLQRAFEDWHDTTDINWVFNKPQIASQILDQTGIVI